MESLLFFQKFKKNTQWIQSAFISCTSAWYLPHPSSSPSIFLLPIISSSLIRVQSISSVITPYNPGPLLFSILSLFPFNIFFRTREKDQRQVRTTHHFRVLRRRRPLNGMLRVRPFQAQSTYVIVIIHSITKLTLPHAR